MIKQKIKNTGRFNLTLKTLMGVIILFPGQIAITWRDKRGQFIRAVKV